MVNRNKSRICKSLLFLELQISWYEVLSILLSKELFYIFGVHFVSEYVTSINFKFAHLILNTPIVG